MLSQQCLEMKEKESEMLLALKMEEGTMSQGVQVASGSCEGKKMDPVFEAPEGIQRC